MGDSPRCDFDHTGYFYSPHMNDTYHRGDRINISWYGGNSTTINSSSSPQFWRLFLLPQFAESLESSKIPIIDPLQGRFSFGQRGNLGNDEYIDWTDSTRNSACEDTALQYVWTIPTDFNLTSASSTYVVLAYNILPASTTSDSTPWNSKPFQILAKEPSNTAGPSQDSGPNPANTTYQHHGPQLSTGGKAGIGSALGVVLILLLSAAFIYMKRWRRNRRPLPPDLDDKGFPELGGKCKPVVRSELHGTSLNPVELDSNETGRLSSQPSELESPGPKGISAADDRNTGPDA